MADEHGNETASTDFLVPWRVAPNSGFVVANGSGNVGLIQINDREFEVVDGFVYDGDAAADIERLLVDSGVEPAEAERRVDEARTFLPRDDNPTDLASIPAFMRWFENPYGVHTLAAILHDEQIRTTPNTGSIGSDALADRFFREMLRSAGVPWLKRWVMWSAVAMRTRWMAGGGRRARLVVWVALAAVGIVSFLGWVFGWDLNLDRAVLLLISAVLPIVAAPLWGKQFGAGLIATIAAAGVLPAAAFAFAGLMFFRVLERIAKSVGLE